MAMGIDDALAAAAAGISLTDTCVKTIQGYRKKGKDIDIELLIEEVRVTALQRMDEADQALGHLERTLVERGVSLNQSLQQAIDSTPFWRPFESHRMKRIRKSFNDLADAAYNAADDIAALVRCKDQTGQMGASIAESSKTKHEVQAKLLNSKSVGESISLLRAELVRHRLALK